MITSEQLELLHKLPKVDLHVHLDGSVKPATVVELAAIQGKSLPAEAVDGDLTPWMQIDDSCQSLKEYLSKFQFVLPFLQTAEALEKVAYEVVEQAAVQNCYYIEVRFAPLLHTLEGLSLDDAIHHTIVGLERGEASFGVKARAIVICLRSDNVEQNIEVVEAAARYYGQGVVAVDLAGDEASFPPVLHHSIFERAGSLDLPITIHAGEAGGSDNVKESIVALGARRIGHGVRIIEDPAVLELVKKTRIPLEMCPVSNIQTKAVSGWEVYPIRQFVEEGIVVTVNTDNMTVSGTTMTLEYQMLMEECGFTLNEIGSLIMNSAGAAFLEEQEKEQLKGSIAAALNELGIHPLSV